MKVRTAITVDIDLAAIYALCTPVDKKKCAAEIRWFVEFQIRMMTDPDGGWRYPDDELIASHLLEKGLAILPE
ncbi:MAG: hypothetical protein BGO63_03840 [Candidatus Accumulibacter sp. 66-26]|nr:MAG: hypothetical protein BGO63_03840 [Candidatus Accumulibacter sp. 66-26]